MSQLAYFQYNEQAKQSITFLHGFCENKNLWKRFADQLQDRYRVVALDLPNFGESFLDSETSVEEMANCVRNTLKGLDIYETVLIGHSLGGYVGMAFAEQYPFMLKGLGMFHSTAFADSEAKREGRQKTIEHIKNYGTKAFLESFFPNLYAPKNQLLYQSAIQEQFDEVQHIKPEALIATLEAMKNRKDRLEVLPNLEMPVLYIIGKEDGNIPLEQSIAQCHLAPKSLVQILEGVGHIGMIEAEKETLRMVNYFADYCYHS